MPGLPQYLHNDITDDEEREAQRIVAQAQALRHDIKFSRYADLMKPKAGPSTGTKVKARTTDDSTKGLNDLVYFMDPEDQVMKTAYPVLQSEYNITDGCTMRCSVFTLATGNNQGMDAEEYGKIYDVSDSQAHLCLFDGPAISISDRWHMVDRNMADEVLAVKIITDANAKLDQQGNLHETMLAVTNQHTDYLDGSRELITEMRTKIRAMDDQIEKLKEEIMLLEQERGLQI